MDVVGVERENRLKKKNYIHVCKYIVLNFQNWLYSVVDQVQR